MSNDTQTAATTGQDRERQPKIYRIQIDREHLEVSEPLQSGRQLLMLAGKTPVERFAIYQKSKGSTERIGLDQVVDLSAPGVERFVTLPLDQTEG